MIMILWAGIGIMFLLLVGLLILDVAYRSGSKKAIRIIDRFMGEYR